MFSAREALIPGGIYDRSRMNVNNPAALRMFYFYFFLNFIPTHYYQFLKHITISNKNFYDHTII